MDMTRSKFEGAPPYERTDGSKNVSFSPQEKDVREFSRWGTDRDKINTGCLTVISPFNYKKSNQYLTKQLGCLFELTDPNKTPTELTVCQSKNNLKEKVEETVKYSHAFNSCDRTDKSIIIIIYPFVTDLFDNFLSLLKIYDNAIIYIGSLKESKIGQIPDFVPDEYILNLFFLKQYFDIPVHTPAQSDISSLIQKITDNMSGTKRPIEYNDESIYKKFRPEPVNVNYPQPVPGDRYSTPLSNYQQPVLNEQYSTPLSNYQQPVPSEEVKYMPTIPQDKEPYKWIKINSSSHKLIYAFEINKNDKLIKRKYEGKTINFRKYYKKQYRSGNILPSGNYIFNELDVVYIPEHFEIVNTQITENQKKMARKIYWNGFTVGYYINKMVFI